MHRLAGIVALIAMTSAPQPVRAAPCGRLPVEVIQRVLRQAWGRFRVCYEASLRNCSNLQGRVNVQFVIDRDGRVSRARATGEATDPRVVTCITDRFRELTFPAPEGGEVHVSYPVGPTAPACGKR